MKTFEISKRAVWGGAIAAAALALMAGPAAAKDVCLRATAFDKSYPDGGTGVTVTMWGYEEYAFDELALPPACDWGTLVSAASVPGPAIDVPVGDNTLDIHLLNGLPAGTPTSVVISGQALPQGSAPVRVGGRIRSAVNETDPGFVGTYSWPSLAAGTYLYRTGTHPQVQQQMGLYGAVTHDSAAGEAYPGVTYLDDAVLLYSEIDPALHAAVAAGDYGPGMSMTSTIDYNPTLFLINGEPFDPAVAGSNEFPVTQNSNALLRLLNAGLTSHVPMTLGLRMTLVAEDGSPYPFPRSQYSALLPAGKAMDAIVQPPEPVRYALVDRAMALVNDGAGPGGMMAFLQASAVLDAPVALDDSGGTTEDHPVSMNVAGNDAATSPATIDLATVTVTSGPFHGNAVPDGAGNVDYTPDLNYNGADSFTYTIDDSDGRTSNTATVSISVTPENDAPVAAADSYDVVEGQILNVAAPGVLANDSDIDVGDTLTAVQDTGTIVLGADGSFSFDATALLAGATDSLTYHANDGLADSATVTVAINVIAAPANVAPVAVDDQLQVVKGTSVDINVLGNDIDPDGTLDPTTVVIVDGPNHGRGQVTVDPVTGAITYVADPVFGGSELFTYAVMDNLGALSNVAKVQVDLVKP